MSQSNHTLSGASSAEIRPEGLYRWDAFCDRIPFSRETWRLRMQAGTAPKPAMQSRNCTAWRGADLLAWLADPEGYRPADAEAIDA